MIDRLYSLDRAAEILSPSGEITIKTLRTLIKRGKLTARRILNRDFVTAADLWEMIEKCRHVPNRLDSGSENVKAVNPPGSSSTVGVKSQQARTKATANTLKSSSKNISPADTKARQAEIIPIRSASPEC